jgi:hypothetical protein
VLPLQGAGEPEKEEVEGREGGRNKGEGEKEPVLRNETVVKTVVRRI